MNNWTEGDWWVEEGIEFSPVIMSGDHAIVGDEGFWGYDLDEQWKNAYLLAASKKLYEALDRLAGVVEPAIPDFNDDEKKAFNAAIYALAQARGEQE